MATVVITVQDTADGRVQIAHKSDPETKGLETATDAQLIAQCMYLYARRITRQESELVEDPKQ